MKKFLVYFAIVVNFSCSKKFSAPNNYQVINPVTQLSPNSFKNPSDEDFPWVRWNFPPETAEIAQLEKELSELKFAGIRGVEIGQGGEPTLNQIEAILKKANEIGIKVSLKYKTGAPTPGSFSPKHDYVRKTLAAADTIIKSNMVFNDSLPGKGTILAVQAYKINNLPAKGSKLLTIDHESQLDLTDKISQINTNGFFGKSTWAKLNWQAPGINEEWVLITIRMQTVDPQPEVFSSEGTKLLIAGYESYWTPDIKNLLKINGGDIFVDSHSIDGFGAPSDVWSSNLALDFEKSVGYDLIKNLPALIDAGIDRVWGRAGAGMDIDHYYTYSNGLDKRIRADYNKVRTRLFIENRIKPFTAWAHQYNLALRLQPEDVPTVNIPDQLDVTFNLDRPEHETLASGDQIDVYRPMASANHISGNTWYSNELAAARSLNYAQTFQDIVIRMNKCFVSGQTKGVYHVYPYAYGPKSVWPGYNTFAEGNFANSWGPRNPIWSESALSINTWMARNEQVLKQGVAKIDVAVYMENYSNPAPFVAGKDNVRFWKDLSLQEHGYTWDYLNPTLLNLPQVSVSKNQLYETGPAYKVFIYNGLLQSASSFNPAKNTLALASAEKILTFAKSGLPVIIVGSLPAHTPGYKITDDDALKSVLESLLLQKNVKRINTEAEVPNLLKSLNILPNASTVQPSNLMSMRRFDKKSETNYYFLYNQGDDQIPGTPNAPEDRYKGLTTTPGNIFEEPKTIRVKGLNYGTKIGKPLNTEIKVIGKGKPYILNAWSGEITPIHNYISNENSVTFNLDLASDQSILVAISENFKVSAVPSYKIDLDLTKNIDLTQKAWDLLVEDWQPTQAYGSNGKAGSETSKTKINLKLNGLKAWPDITELKNVSGVGNYTQTFSLPADWKNENQGAILNLGQVVDAFKLKINGIAIPIDQVSAIVDLENVLKPGENKIEVSVSTTLNNRLVSLNKAASDRGIIQEYGLVGPVTLQAYKKVYVKK